MRSLSAIGLALGVLIVVGAMGPRTGLALTPQQRQVIAQSVGTIVVPAGNKPRVGSCIVVSEHGFVATSLQLLQGAANANVVFRDGAKHEVAGFVAARKGKDLVILALRNPNDVPPPLKLATMDLAPGDSVEFIGSAAAQPFDFSQGELVRYISGRQFLTGLESLSPEAERLDPDTCWLRSDILQPPQGCGAAMLNNLGELTGIVTYVPEWGDRMHTALHAAHIQELLAGLEKTKATPLAALRRFNDPSPQEPPDNVVNTPAIGQMVLPRADADEQFAAWRQRQPALDKELQTLREAVKEYQAKLDQHKAALLALEKKERTIREKLATMQPEETYEEKDKVTKINPRTGKKETDTVTVKKKRFSERQKQQRSAMNAELAKINDDENSEQLNGLRWQSWLQQNQMDEASNKRQSSRLWTDLFYLADPWQLRDGDTHRALQQSLTELIDAEGRSELHLARGVVRHNLQDFEGARDDFQKAARMGNPWAGAAQACEARTLLKDNQESEGRRMLTLATRGSAKDPHVAVVQALVELDAGRFAGVERNLLNALERGADPAELHRVMALVYAAAPDDQPHSARKALEHARRACVLTAWQDSEALLSLAAAHAEGGEFDKARDVASRAPRLATGEVLERARTWGRSFENEQRLRLTWGQSN